MLALHLFLLQSPTNNLDGYTPNYLYQLNFHILRLYASHHLMEGIQYVVPNNHLLAMHLYKYQDNSSLIGMNPDNLDLG